MLKALDDALDCILAMRRALPVEDMPLERALGRIAAELHSSKALPDRATATIDGWAVRSASIVGASSYSPVALSEAPIWVENGCPIPENCDAVIPPEFVDEQSGFPQVLAEIRPGEGVRLMGEDVASGALALRSGQRIRPADLLIAERLGLRTLPVRLPRLHIINVPGHVSGEDGATGTATFIARLADKAGAYVSSETIAGRSMSYIMTALDAAADADLILTIGGTGAGKNDTTVSALRAVDAVLFHGVAISPGRTVAAGRKGDTPVICLPGSADDALAAWWTLVLPFLNGLTERGQISEARPVARKISSSPGMSEIVLLRSDAGLWFPLSVGVIRLRDLADAHAWMIVPGNSEGFPKGTVCEANLLRQ